MAGAKGDCHPPAAASGQFSATVSREPFPTGPGESARVRSYHARLLMITRNADTAALLTTGKAAGSDPASARRFADPANRPEQPEKRAGSRRGIAASPALNGFRVQASAGLCLASATRLRAQRRDLPNMPPSLRSDSGAPCRTLLR
jgi:hypothetical protein